MKQEIQKLTFKTRADFRTWLAQNAETSEGVWLVFGKTKAVVTLTAADALSEALCFGWIDGLMQSVDSTHYLKYFAHRRAKSPWSDKNKQLVDTLRAQNLMTALGEKVIQTAQKNGMWENSPSGAISDAQIADFAQKIAAVSTPAHENYMKLSRSGKVTKIRRYLSVKNEEKRQRNFESIIASLL